MRAFRNIKTNEVVKISGLRGDLENGLYMKAGRKITHAFMERYSDVFTFHNCGTFTLNEGYELIASPKKTKKEEPKKAEPQPRKKAEKKVEKKEEPKKEEKKEGEGKKLHALTPLVLAMVKCENATHSSPFLYGPAGSGKSTIAKQVADLLNLPFESVSALQNKYELEGFADAKGQLVETPLFRLMKNGGVLCFDEITASSPEVLVTFNTVMAQRYYCFPVVGMVQAHPDFHIIACDNTTGHGADRKYSARYELDLSTLDRYVHVKVDYNREHEMAMAEGDADLVRFVHDVRKVLDDFQLNYLATPRGIERVAQYAKIMTKADALFYGLFSSWTEEDMRTVATALPSGNEYHKIFRNEIAK